MTQVSEIASRIWSLSRDRILVNLRFLDVALSGIKLKEQAGMDGIRCDINAPGEAVIYYDPRTIVRLYKKNPNNVIRTHLHILLHCIFSHSYRYGRMEQELWDVAADMAVENAILSLGISGIDVTGDRERRETLDEWRKKAGALTAERIYRNLKNDRLGTTELLELANLFRRDIHESWAAAENAETLEITQEQWKKLSERIKAELKSFSEDKSDDKSILQNLEEATKETYDYGDFLRRFSVSGEDIQVNDDEFD